MEEENSNSIKQGSQTREEIRELERITIINGVNGGGVNLAVTPKIRKLEKAPFGVPLLQQEKHISDSLNLHLINSHAQLTKQQKYPLLFNQKYWGKFQGNDG